MMMMMIADYHLSATSTISYKNDIIKLLISDKCNQDRDTML